MHPTPVPPAEGQESVWMYPRPPRLERSARMIEIFFNGVRIAKTDAAWRVLETSHPPVYYLPPQAFIPGCLSPAPDQSWCEWKGRARYFDICVGGKIASRAAWAYPEPLTPFEPIANYVAVYAAPMDRCLVDGELVTPQPGHFYGGWITSDIVGPFKGTPGSQGW